MPTITLNKKVFEKLVGKKLPLTKLKDRISMLGTDLESIEGNEINVEIFPNRPDMLSEQGLARAFSSFIGVKTGLRNYKVKKSNYEVIVDKSVSKVRPYTSVAVVKNIKFDDEKIKEVIQIQEKLHVTYGRNRKKVAIGIYPMEKITFPIRFTAKKPKEIKFQPLEFPRVLDGLQILSQHSAGRDYAPLLEGLSMFPIFIDAKNKILSMPPIINSHDVGKISHSTKDVFIECSGFDYNVLAKSLNMIVTALADMGGDIIELKLKYPNKTYKSPDLSPSKMKIDINYVNKILGLDLKEKDIKKYLERMGFSYKNKTVFIPSYRSDILHQFDLMEDIAIAYGYENFEEIIPNVATVGEESKIEILKGKIADLLIGLKFDEVMTYNITNKVVQKEDMLVDIPLIELANSLSEEFSCLRAWIIPSLLSVLKHNKHNEYPQNIFDLGTIFKKDTKGKSDTGIVEHFRLGVALCNEKADFTQIKQVLDYLFHSLDLKYNIEETDHPSFIPGRVGRISCNKVQIAYIGELNPRVLANFDLDMPVSCIELNISELFKLLEDKRLKE